MDCVEEELLTLVLNLSFKKGWITENEKLQIKTTGTLTDRKLAILELLNKMECDDNAARLLFSLRCIHAEMNTVAHPAGKVYRFLLKLMFKLFKKGLVTILEFEEQFQEEIEKETENLELTDTNNPQGLVNEMSVAEIIKNPLQLRPVIKCVLQYLNFEEIQTSRLISKEWASAGLPVLIPRSKIIFYHDRYVHQERSPRESLEVFRVPNENNITFPFSNFRFWDSRSSIEELNYFFRNQKQYITELALSELYLTDNNWKTIPGFDITPWISNSRMAIENSETTTSTTKFSVCVSRSSTKLWAQSNVLLNIKDLELIGFAVNLQDGIRISPIRLNIQNCVFTKDGNMLAELCVNDFVNFCKTKEIFLACHVINLFEAQLTLDLNGYHKLKCLDLSEIILRNWSTSRWTVEKLKFHRIPFTERTKMQIRELHIIDSEIDISALPQSIEKLVIDEIDEDTFVATQSIILNNLKKLKLQFEDHGVSTFLQNAQFPNLVSLEMEGNEEIEMDVAWLSTLTNVKTLGLTAFAITNKQNKNLNFDKLVLRQYRLSEITEMCSTHIQTKELVLLLECDTSDPDTDMQFLEFLESQKSFQDCGQIIYVGPLRVTTENPLQPYLDSKEEYYLFQNNLGKPVRSEEFDTEL